MRTRSVALRVHTICTLLAAAVGGAGCGFDFDNPIESLPRGTIRGTLIEGSSASAASVMPAPLRAAADRGQVIAGAECTLEGTDRSATSDSDGVFELRDVAVGSYILICRVNPGSAGERAFLQVVDVADQQVADLGMVEMTPTGSIVGTATLGEATDHTGILVMLPGTSMQGTTNSAGAYALTGVPTGAYTVRFERTGYAAQEFDGVTVASGAVTQMGDVTLSVSRGPTGMITINDGALLSGAREVTVTVRASSDTTLMAFSEDPQFLNVSWEPIATKVSWNFASDGHKRLYARFSDANGLTSFPVSAEIGIDTAPPTAPVVSINGGMAFTPTAQVALSLSATDEVAGVTEMKVSSLADLAGAAWQPFAGSMSFELAAGDGTKHVYARFRDALGHESEVAEDEITLDTTRPPAPTVQIEAEYTNSQQIKVIVYSPSPDAMSVALSEDPAFSGATEHSYMSGAFEAHDFVLSAGDGTKTVYARFKDEAGNVSDAVSDSLILDMTPPTPPQVTCAHQYSNAIPTAGTIELPLAAAATDANLDHYVVCLVGSAVNDATCDSFAIEGPFVASFATSGIHEVSVQGVDKAGNRSEQFAEGAFCFYKVDRDPPRINGVVARPTTSSIVFDASIYLADRDAEIRIEFGTSADALGAPMTMTEYSPGEFSRTVSGLTPRTLYYYRVVAKDAAGNTTTRSESVLTANRDVAQDITVDTTWTEADGPYVVTGWFNVAGGATLTIEPGTRIYGVTTNHDVTAYPEIILTEGNLIAIGSAAKPIVISDVSLVNSDRSQHGWVLQLEHTEMRGWGGIGTYGPDVGPVIIVRDSLLANYTFGRPEIQNGAIRVAYAGVTSTIERNIFLYAGLALALHDSSQQLTVKNNVFLQEAIHQSSSVAAPITIERNSFLGTAGYSAVAWTGAVGLNLANNYWGTTDAIVIASRIYDYDVDPSLGDVTFTPLLTAPDAATPDPSPYLP